MKSKTTGKQLLAAHHRAFFDLLEAARREKPVAASAALEIKHQLGVFSELCRELGIAREFQAGAAAFAAAAEPKREEGDGFAEFCTTWLRIGVYHAQGALLPFPSPKAAARMALASLELSAGPEWQDKPAVSDYFAIPRHRYGEAQGQTWSQIGRGDRREVVRQKLLVAAKKFHRRSEKFLEALPPSQKS